MNRHLEQLIELSKIDKEIDSFEPRMEKLNREYNKILSQKNEILLQIQNFEDEKKDSKNKKSKNEVSVAELSKKLDDIAKKTKAIKTEKEQRALNLEEDITKEQLSFANDEIARLEKIIDNFQDKIATAKAELTTIEEKLGEKEQEAKSSLEKLAKEREVVCQNKIDLTTKMDSKINGFYEKIKRWAGNSTVVNVKKQACYGCFMKLSDRTYAEVIKAEDIITCPHCGRIMYIERDEAV